jgi:hypothetical protein
MADGALEDERKDERMPRRQETTSVDRRLSLRTSAFCTVSEVVALADLSRPFLASKGG